MNAIDQLDLLITTLEAETLLRDAQFDAGMIPPGVNRPLEPWEEGTDWVAIAAALGVAYTTVEEALAGFRDVYVDDLERVLAGVSGETAWSRLLAWTQQLPRPVRQAAQKAVRQIAAAYSTLQGTSSRIAAQDAERAGVRDAVRRFARPGEGVDRWLTVATSPVLWLPARMVQAITKDVGAQPPDPKSIVDLARSLSLAGGVDLGRQGAHKAAGAGRLQALQQFGPDEFGYAYASELLDENTCGPCAGIDGKRYSTLEGALVDYPGLGGHKNCDGGDRCRGTVVIVGPNEAPPTLQRPNRDPDPMTGPDAPTTPPAGDRDSGAREVLARFEDAYSGRVMLGGHLTDPAFNLPRNAAEQITGTLERLLDDYPQIGRIEIRADHDYELPTAPPGRWFGVTSPAATTGTGLDRVTLNALMLDTPGMAQSVFGEGLARGLWAAPDGFDAGRALEYAVVHEWGHVLSYSALGGRTPRARDAFMAQLRERAARLYSIAPMHFDQWLNQGVSGYAIATPFELMAEGFAAFWFKGAAATNQERLVWNLIREGLRL